MPEMLEGTTSIEDRISELEDKIAAVCMRLRCPRVKWYTGFFKCRVGQQRCHSARVRGWLDEIKKLEEGK